MNIALPPTAWTIGSTEVFKTGTWRAMLPRHVAWPSPCHQACPVNGEIAQWIGHARAGDLRRAWEVLTLNNPFPAIAGRVCHHPCEAACNRAQYDEAVSVCRLERAVGDAAIAGFWQFAPVREALPAHIAVVGGGPSGLSAAYQLRRRGWRVSLYEAQDELGGVMRYGIPDYRLPRDVLDAELARILAMGLEVHCTTPITSRDHIDRLLMLHDAVYIATGAPRPKRLPQLPAAAPWLMTGAEYLAQSNAGAPPQLGHRVCVIGGGSAAMDVARSALRAGCTVHVLSLEARAEMPAQPEEVVEALAEGIVLHDAAVLRSVVTHADGTLALDCERLAGGGFMFAVDAVITAIGQDADLAAFSGAAIAKGVLDVDSAQATTIPNVWAGGDVASSTQRYVTEAIGTGKRAAIDIDRALRGEVRVQGAPSTAVTFGEIATWYHPHGRRPPAGALDATHVAAEATRCFSCGTCTSCDNCVEHCPDLAVVHLEQAYGVLTDYCKGCGICVRECPSGSMLLEEEMK